LADLSPLIAPKYLQIAPHLRSILLSFASSTDLSRIVIFAPGSMLFSGYFGGGLKGENSHRGDRDFHTFHPGDIPGKEEFAPTFSAAAGRLMRVSTHGMGNWSDLRPLHATTDASIGANSKGPLYSRKMLHALLLESGLWTVAPPNSGLILYHLSECGA
jgi:hypothetical protein